MISWNESDVEDYFYNNPGSVHFYTHTVDHWAARQYRIPSGIVDLIGAIRFDRGYFPLVVELKNRPVRSEDLAQIARYASDLERILSRDVYKHPTPGKLLLAPGDIQNSVLHEANALDIEVRPFDVSIGVNLRSAWSWTKEHKAEIDKEIEAASHDAVFYSFAVDFPVDNDELAPFEDFITKLEDKDNGE